MVGSTPYLQPPHTCPADISRVHNLIAVPCYRLGDCYRLSMARCFSGVHEGNICTRRRISHDADKHALFLSHTRTPMRNSQLLIVGVPPDAVPAIPVQVAQH
jgi:hypothetical protein